MNLPRNRRNRNCNANLAEFGPVLLFFFLLMVFPLINLVGMAAGYASAYTLTLHWATVAANSSTIESATNVVNSVSASDLKTGLAKLVSLNASNVNVYGLRTQVVNGSVQYIGPNQYAPAPLNTTDFVYEYLIRTKFVQQPFIKLSAVPWICDVPGLGQAWTYTIGEFRAAEYPDGFVTSPAIQSGGYTPPGGGFSLGEWQAGWPPIH